MWEPQHMIWLKQQDSNCFYLISFIIKAHLPSVHCYADDTQLYIFFSRSEDNGGLEAVKAIELCVKDIRSWMSKDKRSMNDEKTEFLIIETRQHIKKGEY